MNYDDEQKLKQEIIELVLNITDGYADLSKYSFNIEEFVRFQKFIEGHLEKEKSKEWINGFEAGLRESGDRVRSVFHKYEGSEEMIRDGKRYLKLTDFTHKELGYPFPETKEKHMLKEIKKMFFKESK